MALGPKYPAIERAIRNYDYTVALEELQAKGLESARSGFR